MVDGLTLDQRQRTRHSGDLHSRVSALLAPNECCGMELPYHAIDCIWIDQPKVVGQRRLADYHSDRQGRVRFSTGLLERLDWRLHQDAMVRV